MRKFAVFDIDWTLHPSALGTEFYAELGRAGLIPHNLEEHLENWKNADDCGAYFMEHFYPLSDELVGLSRDQLHAVGRRLAERVESTIYPELREIIDRHKADGRVLLAITSSPHVVAEPLAEILGFDKIRASEFRYDDNELFTEARHRTDDEKDKGKVLSDLVNTHNLSWQDSAAYGDSLDDLPMLELVSRPVAVNPGPELAAIADERGWRILRTS